MLAWASMERDGYESDQNRLFVMDWATRTRKRVDDWDLTVGEFTWSPDGRWFYLAADTQGTHQIFRVPSVGGTPKPVTGGRSHFSSPVLTNDGSSMFALRMSTERPYEIVEIPIIENRAAYPETGVVVQETVRQITNVNGAHYANLRLPTVEQEFFEATDGAQIHCWVIYPPDFDPAKKYPMLTYCQGGPQSQVGQWFSFRWNFHLMAAQGYIVLAINRRGLPGFGTAWNEQISGDWGGQAMQDYLSATDAMFEKPFVDRDRTGAIGASFGGYSTYWLMGHDQDDRFCAMISHCGVFNLESMYLSTEELFLSQLGHGRPFWASPELKELYDRFSPHRYVQKLGYAALGDPRAEGLPRSARAGARRVHGGPGDGCAESLRLLPRGEPLGAVATERRPLAPVVLRLARSLLQAGRVKDESSGKAKGLIDRLGGVESVRALLDRFYRRLFDDVMVGFFFVGHDRAKIVDGQLQFLRWATGDRDDLPGRHPRSAHDELPPILGGHFDRRLVVLEEVLRAEGVDDDGSRSLASHRALDAEAPREVSRARQCFATIGRTAPARAGRPATARRVRFVRGCRLC